MGRKCPRDQVWGGWHHTAIHLSWQQPTALNYNDKPPPKRHSEGWEGCTQPPAKASWRPEIINSRSVFRESGVGLQPPWPEKHALGTARWGWHPWVPWAGQLPGMPLIRSRLKQNRTVH